MSGSYTNSNGANIVFFFDYILIFSISVPKKSCPCGFVKKFKQL